MYRKFWKRVFGIIFSLGFFLMFWWVYIVVSILVRIKLGSPTIFKQRRPGLNEKIFTMYKFRTMTEEKDENGRLLSDEKRLTDFGKMLRATSLDEIPEFFNVLKGDMSLVGPRPLLIAYLKEYNKRQLRRHEVKPGITGLAQVNGRNAISWEEKFDYDIKYVDNLNIILDMKIIFATIKKIFIHEGISQEGEATMEAFKGGENGRN
ncbi:MAG: sugar transferase [Fusobacterium sp. JB019]|nr:sugar transferase [Fusobacterium sp. JB019]